MASPGLLDKLLSGESPLSTNGITPPINTVAGENGVQTLLDSSNLDLDGQRPPTYAENAPEGQAGRI